MKTKTTWLTVWVSGDSNSSPRNIAYLHTRVDQDNRDGLNHKYSNWICIIYFCHFSPSWATESSLDSLCTEFHWGHLNLKSYFLTDSFCLRYDNDIWSNAASFWLVQIPSHESVWPMTSLVTLLFNDHWLFITISSWFSEKSPVQPGPEVKAAKCETDWENYQGITNLHTNR